VVLHLRAQGPEEGDQHPPTLSCGAWVTLPLPNVKWLKTGNVENNFIVMHAQTEIFSGS